MMYFKVYFPGQADWKEGYIRDCNGKSNGGTIENRGIDGMENVTSGVLEISIPCILSWDLLEETNSDGTDSWGVHWIFGQRGQMSWMRHF